jgi:hypothetical protein
MTLRLRPYVLITYLVPPDRLGPHLPSELELRTLHLNDGSERALISIFCGQARWIRAWGLPVPEDLWRYLQVNIRTYIIRQGEDGIFFFRSFIGSKLAAWAAQRVMGFPAQHAGIDLDVVWKQEQNAVHRLRLQVNEDLDIMVAGESTTLQPYEGFPDADTALRILTHPLIGFFRRPDGELGALATQHPRVSPSSGQLVKARLPWMLRQGFLEASEIAHPYAVMIAPSADFDLLVPAPAT